MTEASSAGSSIGSFLRRSDLPGAGVLLCACAVLLLTAPTDGDFWWFEAPSHAMNGVFIRDFVAAMPWDGDPVGFAIDYYLRYPAVTVLFYPPLFPAIEAVFFAVFGVSHFTAQLAVTAFLLAFALGMRRLARFWLPEPAALGVGLASLGLPLVTFWGRQVMLEMPAYAFLVWSSYCFVRYLRDGGTRQIVLAAVLLVAGLYVKQTLAFAALGFAAALVWQHGPAGLARRGVWIAAALAAVLLVPLAGLTLRFGSMNMDLATGGATADAPRGLWSSLGYYAGLLPPQAGWIVVGFAALFLLLEVVSPWRGQRDPVLTTMVATFAAGYAFFTAIALKDERYAIHILAPLALFAVAAVYRLAPARFAGLTSLAFGAGVFAFGVTAVTVPRIDGHRAAAEFVAASAPEHSTILFHGQRSASFIFNLYALGTRRDLDVLRAEKLLVHYRQGRNSDLRPLEVSRSTIESYFPRFRIGYAVFETGFWTDLDPIRTLETVLATPPLSLVQAVQVAANVPHNDRELRIYRNDGPISASAEPFAFDMGLIGSRFSARGRPRPR